MARGALMRFSDIDVLEARAAIDQGDMARAAKVRSAQCIAHVRARSQTSAPSGRLGAHLSVPPSHPAALPLFSTW